MGTKNTNYKNNIFKNNSLGGINWHCMKQKSEGCLARKFSLSNSRKRSCIGCID